MASIFPLTSGFGPHFKLIPFKSNIRFMCQIELWIEWIEDEKSIAASASEKVQILSLFERAIADYPTTKIWTSYIDFITEEYRIGMEEDGESWVKLEYIRSVSDAAIESIGTHFTESHIVWNIIKDFEFELLSESLSDEGIKRLRAMFHSRLKVPHQALNQTYDDYSPFESQFDPVNYIERLKAVKAIQLKTEQEVSIREKQEHSLAVYHSRSVEGYLSYIAFERARPKGGDAGRIRTLYERAIETHCLDPVLWESYILYSVHYSKASALSVSQRSVRNCMYNANLWCYLMRVQEMCRKSIQTIDETFQRSVSFVSALGDKKQLLSLMRCRCEIGRLMTAWDVENCSLGAFAQLLRETLAYIESIDECDPDSTFTRYCAREMLHTFANVDEATTLFDKAIKKSSQFADVWLDLVSFERLQSNFPKARSLYKQALVRSHDQTERICNEWTEFERIHGDTDSFLDARSKILQAMQKKRTVQRSEGHEEVSVADLKRNQPAVVHNETEIDTKRLKLEVSNEIEDKEMDDVKPEQVKKQQEVQYSEYKVIDVSTAGNMLYLENLPANATESAIRKAFTSFGNIIDIVLQPEEESGELEAFVEFNDAESVRKVVAKGEMVLGVVPRRCRPSRPGWNFKMGEEKSKIFVSNLSRQIDKPKLRSIFNKFGKIREIRIVLKKQPSVSCFAYIDFYSEESAKNSLQLDQTVVDHEKISVAISDPSKRNVRQIDYRVIYVSNLPLSATEEMINDVFGKHGDIRGVRLVYKENSRFKGSCFIEFASEEQGKSALTLNGTPLEGRVIAVTVSDPNIRKGKRFEESRDVHLSGSVSVTRFTPRQNQHPSGPKRKSMLSMNAKETQSGGEIKQADKKSVDDFRKLLLK